MAILSFKDIRAKWRSSKDNGWSPVNVQQRLPHQEYYAPPQTATQAGWTSEQFHRQPVNVQYIAPFTPDHVGQRQLVQYPDPNQPQELPGMRGRWATESEQNMTRDEYLRRKQREQCQSHFREAKIESRGIVEQRQRADAEKQALERQRNASKESVRQLRELVRERYRLDLHIWKERDALPADRGLIMEDCKRADELLRRIHNIVGCWDEEPFTKEDWQVAEEIKEGILAAKAEGGHMLWAQKPPWEYESDEESFSDDGWND